MTNPVLEDDVVERLRSRCGFWRNGAHWLMSTDPDPDCQEAAALIEQQRRTIEELRERNRHLENGLIGTESVLHNSSMALERLAKEAAEMAALAHKISDHPLLQGDKKE